MRCARCHNLLIREIFVDYETDSGPMSFLGYRCVGCGDILDETILHHRAGLAPAVFRSVRTPRFTALSRRTRAGNTETSPRVYAERGRHELHSHHE